VGTKNNPGEFDCYAKAEPDEPMFTLLARDPQFANLVRLWAALRRRNYADAAAHFSNACFAASIAQHKDSDLPKAQEANQCAVLGLRWRSDAIPTLIKD
jgi:hypothetical protein